MTSAHASEQAVFAAFADLLSYPRGDLAASGRECLAAGARQCAALVGKGSPSAAGLRRFAAWAEKASAGEAEEVYSATFDLDPVCVPYIGHHLCPDPARRNLFLGALAALYANEGFAPGEELSDHLTEVLRFLAVTRDADARIELIRDGLLPALAAMKASFAGTGNPYQPLIEALLAYVSPRARKRAGLPGEARP